jgi:hypothetical protein
MKNMKASAEFVEMIDDDRNVFRTVVRGGEI